MVRLLCWHIPSLDLEVCCDYLRQYNLIDLELWGKKSRTRLLSQWARYHALADYLDCSPIEITLSKTPSERPICISHAVDFNISHSGEWLGMAISKDTVGVDIEHIKPQRNIRAIAQRYFSPQEYDDLCLCDDFRQAFYQLWTLKEATVKYTGEGIARGLNQHIFQYDHGCWHYTQQDKYFYQYQLGEYAIAVVSTVESNIEVVIAPQWRSLINM